MERERKGGEVERERPIEDALMLFLTESYCILSSRRHFKVLFQS